MEWVEIVGFNGRYFLNKNGDIKSFARGKEIILSRTLNSKGYVQHGLYRDGKTYCYLLSRLLAIYFIPNPNNYQYVNHIDGNPLNNDLSNLEWCTPKQNVHHGWQTGLCWAYKGAAHPTSKRVIAIYPSGEEKEFGSLTIAGKELGVEGRNIGFVLKGVRKSVGPYKFRYPGKEYAYKPKKQRDLGKTK